MTANAAQTLGTATRHFHDLLLEELSSTREALSEAIQARGLIFAQRPICDTVRPLFMCPSEYRAHMRAATLVAAGLAILTRRLATAPDLRRNLSLSDVEETFVEMDSREPIELFGRMDGFQGEDGVIRFIEYNPLGGGVVDCDELADVFFEMPVMKRFRQRYACQVVSTRARIPDAFLRAHRGRGKSGVPRIGILKPHLQRGASGNTVLSASVLDLPETRKSLAMARAVGCSIRQVEAEQLTFDGRELRDRDSAVDVLIAADWPRTLAEVGAGAPLWRAIRSGAAWILNSPTVDILRANKKTFALLADPEFDDLFPAEVVAALRRHLPWTRIVREGRTTYREAPIDLLPFLASHRESLVLKPADGYGGHGVTMGWSCGDAAWNRALDDALRGSYVAQERVQAPRDAFPTVFDGALSFQERYYDFNPFVWNGMEAAGCMIRLSPTPLMNQSAGGGSNIPMILLEGPASA